MVLDIGKDLLDAVQEHVDAAYMPTADIASDCIDWATAEKNAHEHLDKHVGHAAVQKALDFFKY